MHFLHDCIIVKHSLEVGNVCFNSHIFRLEAVSLIMYLNIVVRCLKSSVNSLTTDDACQIEW